MKEAFEAVRASRTQTRDTLLAPIVLVVMVLASMSPWFSRLVIRGKPKKGKKQVVVSAHVNKGIKPFIDM